MASKRTIEYLVVIIEYLLIMCVESGEHNILTFHALSPESTVKKTTYLPNMKSLRGQRKYCT